MTKKIELLYYDQKEVWKRYEDNILDQSKRATNVIKLVPNDVESILDIGCGNGILTNLINKPFVVGVDFARVPLTKVKTNTIQASIDKLPIRSKSFDLCLLSEVLEHLDDETYIKATKEIERLRPIYLLISVPYNENIELDLCKCKVCGNLFNESHHYRKFDTSWNKEFSEYYAEKIEYSSYYIPLSNKIVKLQQIFGIYSKSKCAVCNICGNLYQPIVSNQIIEHIFKGLIITNKIINKILGIRRPYHQIILLKRSEYINEKI